MASSVFIWPGLFSFSGTVGAIDALAFDRANQDVYLARVGTQDLGIYTGGINGVGGTLRFDVSATQATSTVPIVGPFGNNTAPGLAISSNDGWYGSAGVMRLALAGAANQAVFTNGAGSVNGTWSFSSAIMSGKATTYNNVATAGWGTPAIYAAGRTVGAVNATVGSVSAYTVGAADGSFLVTANVNVTAVTAAAMTVTCAYTDETNTGRTLTLAFTQLTGATLLTSITNVTGTGPYEGFPFHIRCKAATTITFATAGTVTGITYNVEGIALQLA